MFSFSVYLNQKYSYSILKTEKGKKMHLKIQF